jgi:hypothetical protein
MSNFEVIVVAGVFWVSFVLWLITRHLEKIEENLADIKKDIEEIRDAQELKQ